MPDNDRTAILELLKVGRTATNSKGPIRIIDDISHTFIKGGVYNIVGPSGAGKSSLLRLLNRLDEPTEGKILFHGKPVPEYPPTELRKKISMLFQIPYLFPGTVQYNLDYCCRKTKGHRVDESQKHNLADLLERVGLKSEFAAKDGSELSVGEKQRVAIARALVQEPEVLLLDEPTSALDPSLVQIIEQLILGLVRDLSFTAIVVTHNPDQALRMGGETLLLVGGRLIETGPTDRVLTKPSSELGWKYIRRELV